MGRSIIMYLDAGTNACAPTGVEDTKSLRTANHSQANFLLTDDN